MAGGLIFQNFRSDVVRRSANGVPFFIVEFEFGCKPEVSEFYLHVIAEKKISQFETRKSVPIKVSLLSVDDPVHVQVLEGIADLIDVTLNLYLHKSSPALDEIVQTLNYA